MCVLVCVMHCVPPQELQGRLEKAIFAYVILAGPHFLGYAAALCMRRVRFRACRLPCCRRVSGSGLRSTVRLGMTTPIFRKFGRSERRWSSP